MNFGRIVLGLGLLCAAPIHAEAPAIPVYRETFEIPVELDDPDKAVIDQWPQFLKPNEGWEQVFGVLYARSARSGLKIGGAAFAGERSRRYLFIPMSGASALVLGPEIRLKPELKLRFRGDLSWLDQGRGSIEVGLQLPDGQRIAFLSGRGTRRSWHTQSRVVELPAGLDQARLAIWTEGDPLARSRDGGYGIDNLVVEEIPQAKLTFRGSLHRLTARDMTPINVRTIAFPPGEYWLDFTVFDVAGQALFTEKLKRYVSEGLPIDFNPPLDWTRHGTQRGLYRIQMRLGSLEGWSIVLEREFALAGLPPFEFDALGRGKWVVEVPSVDERPDWLILTGPVGYLFPVKKTPVGLDWPEWVEKVGEFQRRALFGDPSQWDPGDVDLLKPYFHHVHSWFWLEPVADSIPPFLAALKRAEPVIRLGITAQSEQTPLGLELPVYELPVRVYRDPEALLEWSPQPPFVAHVDLAKFPKDVASQSFATVLYILEALGPEVTIVSHADETLVTREKSGGLVPRRLALTWEFVTGFLSKSTFVRFERGRSGIEGIVFEREGRNYLVALPALDSLTGWSSGRVEVYDSVGVRRDIGSQEGQFSLELEAEPYLVAGLDTARSQVVGSLRLELEPLVEGRQTELQVTVTNFFSEPATFRPELKPPSGWPRVPDLAAQAIPPGETGSWTTTVTLPDWFGVLESADFKVELAVELESGRTWQSDLERSVLVESGLLGIRTKRVDRQELVITITNRSTESLRFAVYFHLESAFRERKIPGNLLSAGESRDFRFEHDGARGSAYVGIVVENGPSVYRTISLDP